MPGFEWFSDLERQHLNDVFGKWRFDALWFRWDEK